MGGKAKTYFNWSSGKDAALALHLLKENNIEVDLLLTTVNAAFNRVSMHGVRRNVLEAQARSLDIPLDILEVPENPSMDDYNRIMTKKIQTLQAQNYSRAIFGDIFLEDLRRYREKMLAPFGVRAIFPLWKKDTRRLIEKFLDLRYSAVVVCVDSSKLDASFLGKKLDKTLIDRLPDNVDPCGENGEFHTFCFDGPIFKNAVPIKIGETVFHTYDDPADKNGTKKLKFGFCDLILDNTPQSEP